MTLRHGYDSIQVTLNRWTTQILYCPNKGFFTSVLGGNMNTKKTRKLVDGAIVAAIFGLLFMIDLYLGSMLGYYLYLVLPILIVWYEYRYTLKDTLILSVAVLCITFIVASPMSLFYAVFALLIGTVAGYQIKKQMASANLFLSLIAMTLLSNILTYTVFAGLFGMDLVQEATEIYNMVMNFAQTYLNQTLTIGMDYFLKLIPLIVLFTSLIEAYLIVILMMLVLPRLKIPFKYQFNFLTMTLPKWLGVALIGVMGLHYFIKDQILLDYLDIILKATVVLQGLSCVGFYFAVQKKTLFYFVAMILTLVPYTWYIYGTIGMIDIMFGLKRKIMYNR